MLFKCEIEMGNAAFEEPGEGGSYELHRILLVDVVGATLEGRTEGACMDVNGNRVGNWAIGEAPEVAAHPPGELAMLPMLTWQELEFLANSVRRNAGARPANSLLTAIREAQASIPGEFR